MQTPRLTNDEKYQVKILKVRLDLTPEDRTDNNFVDIKVEKTTLLSGYNLIKTLNALDVFIKDRLGRVLKVVGSKVIFQTKETDMVVEIRGPGGRDLDHEEIQTVENLLAS